MLSCTQKNVHTIIQGKGPVPFIMYYVHRYESGVTSSKPGRV